MSKIHIIEVVKEKTPYKGSSQRGPYTIYSKVCKAEVDGTACEAEVKTFKEEHNVLCVAGSSWVGEQDLRSVEKGYKHVYTLKSILAAGAAPTSSSGSSSGSSPSGSRDLIIQAQTCLKAAVDLVASCTDAAAYGSLAERKIDVLVVADEFLAWVTERGSGKKPNAEVPDDLPFS